MKELRFTVSNAAGPHLGRHAPVLSRKAGR